MQLCLPSLRINAFFMAGLVSLACVQFAFAQEPESKPPSDSISHFISVGYNGSNVGLSYAREIKWFGSYENFIYGFGVGADIDFSNIPVFLLLRYDILDLSNLGGQRFKTKIFLGSNIGFNISSSDYVFKFDPFVGIAFNDWFNISLGYAITDDSDSDGITAMVSYPFKTAKRDDDFIRLGLNIDFAVWQSKNELIGHNTFGSSGGVGAGLFLRLHFAEWFYLQSGAAYHLRVLEKETTLSNLASDIGIDLGTLGGIIGNNVTFIGKSEASFLEIPMLLCLGSGQVRFVAGMLFGYNLDNQYIMELETPIANINLSSIEEIIEKRLYDKHYKETEVYVVTGLDIDVVRHFGVSGRFLIPAGNSIEIFSIRTSIYFVF